MELALPRDVFEPPPSPLRIQDKNIEVVEKIGSTSLFKGPWFYSMDILSTIDVVSVHAKIKISINTDILILKFYEYNGNINDYLDKNIRNAKNYSKFIKMIEKNFKNDKISKKKYILKLVCKYN